MKQSVSTINYVCRYKTIENENNGGHTNGKRKNDIKITRKS